MVLVDVIGYITVGGAALSLVVWANHHKARIDSHDILFIEREKLAAGRHADVTGRLERIEHKLDRVGKETHQTYSDGGHNGA